METEKMNILVVEDNLGDVRLLQETFKRDKSEKFNLVHAPGLQSAFKRLSNDKIDLILLDLTLPGTSGLETLKKVHEKNIKTPVIILTGVNDEKTALQALRIGAQGYFYKDPIGWNALARTLRYTAERRQMDGEEPTPVVDLAAPSDANDEKISILSLDGPAQDFEDIIVSSDQDLLRLLETEKIEAHFQPWISVADKSLVGFQGICEGKTHEPEDLLSPAALLKMVSFLRFSASLNRLLRKELLENFKPLSEADPRLILNVSFDIDGPDGEEKTLADFLSMVRACGIDPGHVTIEIGQNQPGGGDRLRRFVESLHARNFLAMLDGGRLDYSNLDSMMELKPDMIKAGRNFVADIEKNFPKREMFRSLMKVAHGWGALLLAQGIETEAEAMTVLKLGADWLQGGFIDQPQKAENSMKESLQGKIDEVFEKFKNYRIVNANIKRSCYAEYIELIHGISRELAAVMSEAFEVILFTLVQRYSQLEGLAVLNKEGRQLCRVWSGETHSPQWSALFKPTESGMDHSTKDYYFQLMQNHDKEFTYFSEPYLSRDTRRLCVTVSMLFKDAFGEIYVLCADVKPERLLAQG